MFKLLISFYYFRTTNLDELVQKISQGAPIEVFADSGAYSAFSQNEEIDVVAYADWLHRWQHIFTVQTGLDDKTSWRKGMANQRYLESRGLAPIPVYHIGEPFDLLRDLVEEYPYLGLGGVAGRMPKEDFLLRNFAHAFQIAEGKAVFHGFGMTRINQLRLFPFYSVDSSTWTSGWRFGFVNLFNPRAGDYVRADLGKRQHWVVHSDWLAELGFDWRRFAERAVARHEVDLLSAASYSWLEHWVRLLHGDVAVRNDGKKESGRNLIDARSDLGVKPVSHTGLKLYLAGIPVSQIISGFEGCQHFEQYQNGRIEKGTFLKFAKRGA